MVALVRITPATIEAVQGIERVAVPQSATDAGITRAFLSEAVAATVRCEVACNAPVAGIVLVLLANPNAAVVVIVRAEVRFRSAVLIIVRVLVIVKPAVLAIVL